MQCLKISTAKVKKMIIRLPIDVKSLYLNIKNDNEAGHTATVATPISQYGGVNEQLARVYQIPETLNVYSREELISMLLARSRAEAKITNVYVFDKLSVNGCRIESNTSFAMYVREETKEGYIHCGRRKLHYPISLKYSDEEVDINNKSVLKTISEFLADYAFIIEAFEYDTETGVLNFDAIIVGNKNIPYSKVFINRRGAGGKFTTIFSEEAESYDTEIIALREKFGFANVSPANYTEVIDKNRLLAERVAYEELQAVGAENIRNLSSEYPYALYNFEYLKDGIKNYLIVRYTATKVKYFNLSINKIKFINTFADKVAICLVTDINGDPKTNFFKMDDLGNMSKTINSICYECTEE